MVKPCGSRSARIGIVSRKYGKALESIRKCVYVIFLTIACSSFVCMDLFLVHIYMFSVKFNQVLTIRMSEGHPRGEASCELRTQSGRWHGRWHGALVLVVGIGVRHGV